MKILICLLLSAALASNGFAQTNNTTSASAASAPTVTTDTQPEKITFTELFTEMPATSWTSIKNSFKKDTIPDWIAILGSTAILYHNDEVILRDFQRTGRANGISNEDKTKAIATAGDIDLIRVPVDTSSFLYFLGDGFMHGSIALGFLASGYARENNRAFNTGMQMVHGMAVSTVFSQFLKRSFGRESPYVKSEDFGRWSPYPSIPEYQARTAHYDAMPSGHIMTTTLMFTIMNENYPEYSNYIIPIGVVWGSALMFGMVNNGVHWASDYPLGIAMGVVFGKASAQLGKKPKTEAEKQASKDWMLLPLVTPESTGVNFVYQF